MRHLLYGVLAALFLATPASQAFAQSTSANTSAAPRPPQTQPSSTDNKPAPEKTAKPATPPAQAPKDDSITNYDVNGSNASDAMGGAP